MKPSVAALARHRLQRARDTLREADALLETGRWPGALNRLDYAAFYAARAVLATAEVDSSRHSGVVALFQQHYVRTGIISDDVARVLPRALQKRQQSDYADYAEPSGEEVTALREPIRGFIDACARAVDGMVDRHG